MRSLFNNPQVLKGTGLLLIVYGVTIGIVTFGSVYVTNIDGRTTEGVVQVAELICSDSNDPDTCYDDGAGGSAGDSMGVCDSASSAYDQYACDPYYGTDPCSDIGHPDYDATICDPYYGIDPCSDTSHPDYDPSICGSAYSCDLADSTYDPYICEPYYGTCDVSSSYYVAANCGGPTYTCDPRDPAFDTYMCENPAYSCNPADSNYDSYQCGDDYNSGICDTASPDYNYEMCNPDYDECDTSNPDFDQALCTGSAYSCDTFDLTYDESKCVVTSYSCDSTDQNYNEYECVSDSIHPCDPYSSAYDPAECTIVGNPCDPTDPEYDQLICETEYDDHNIDVTFDQDEPYSGRLTVTTYTNDVEKFSFFMDDLFYGKGVEVTAGEWSYVIDTTLVSDGYHDAYLKIYFINGDTRLSDRHSIIIQNSETEALFQADSLDLRYLLDPDIQVDVVADDPIMGSADVMVKVSGAEFVQLYAIPQFSSVLHFLGLAAQISTDLWRFEMDTTNAPNGVYKLFARIKNQFGLFESERVFISIENDVSIDHTEEEEFYINEIKETQIEIYEALQTTDKLLSTNPLEDSSILDSTDKIFAEEIFNDFDEKAATEKILDRFKIDLREIIGRLAIAFRENDTAEGEEIKGEMIDLRNRVIEEATDLNFSADLVAQIDLYVDELSRTLEESTIRNEKIIRDRVGEAAVNDSDKDGITDYDEINLYRTDPFVADSDGDGFTDGAEVLGGFDPTNSAAEALVVYESPVEKGIVREDILVVDSILAAEIQPGDITSGQEPGAVISGKGLPNSFVTLYIFSIPIIVTVKTDSEGAWSYRFDKELEDGTHEIYVGITDNAGRIIAKSKPLSFVKEAQAFTIIGTAEAAEVIDNITTPPPQLFSQYSIVIIVIAGIILLGIILYMLGSYVMRRQEFEMKNNQSGEAAA